MNIQDLVLIKFQFSVGSNPDFLMMFGPVSELLIVKCMQQSIQNELLKLSKEVQSLDNFQESPVQHGMNSS